MSNIKKSINDFKKLSYDLRKNKIVDILSNIKDICLDLSDNNIKYYLPNDIIIGMIANIIYDSEIIISYMPFINMVRNKEIENPHNSESLKDIFAMKIEGNLNNKIVLYVIEHINSYMDSIGFKTFISYNNLSDKEFDIKEFDDKSDSYTELLSASKIRLSFDPK